MGGGGGGEGKERESGRWCKLLLLTLLACVDSVFRAIKEGSRTYHFQTETSDELTR